ncbi:endonuclease/exonuclease/phosphatase family protein [Shimia sp. R11_0]|uniref:endonuclease/exonuclease/phosphatase family protein n=1 Tax=Shimia sp. R11_0 TaxID=2821096 RepID=UPI001FFE0AB2|nr:endonuclease/exonuclease/phosphatase family protein [Shimia sp. R11_0]
MRIATYDVELSRKGPGLMLRDIQRGTPQVQAITQVVSHIAPDILFLQGVDYDADLLGLTALRDHFATQGIIYPHLFALPPNTGLPTSVDLNGDGIRHRAADAQGYGKFRGAGGMALLSKWPIALQRDFTALLWKELPDAQLPSLNGAPFPSQEAQDIQRLSSTGHWVVTVTAPSGPISLLLFAAGPPVFDGPEDRNGLRNADEIRLWTQFLDGKLGPLPDTPLVLLGGANLDPIYGEGRHAAIHALLAHPRLQDPLATAGPTVDWRDPTPGDLRVDYLLPSRDVTVSKAGIFWPKPPAPLSERLSFSGTIASRHHIVWADIQF